MWFQAALFIIVNPRVFVKHLLSIHSSSVFTQISPLLHNTVCPSVYVLFKPQAISKSEKAPIAVHQQVSECGDHLWLMSRRCHTFTTCYQQHHQHHQTISMIHLKTLQACGGFWDLLTSQSNLQFINRTLANINDAIMGWGWHCPVQCRAPDWYCRLSSRFSLAFICDLHLNRSRFWIFAPDYGDPPPKIIDFTRQLQPPCLWVLTERQGERWKSVLAAVNFTARMRCKSLLPIFQMPLERTKSWIVIMQQDDQRRYPSHFCTRQHTEAIVTACIVYRTMSFRQWNKHC